ncbi:MAG: hypothetical protein JRN67_10805 [Nitrososphaerota archaeon]|nr:hypothetical protein [Nitrososphaerota archaeon]
MAVSLGLLVGGITAVFVAVMLLSGMRGRGRLIECPECGATFKRPAFAQKNSGLGFTFSDIGSFACPKCRHRGSTSSFSYVDKRFGSGSNEGKDEEKKE